MVQIPGTCPLHSVAAKHFFSAAKSIERILVEDMEQRRCRICGDDLPDTRRHVRYCGSSCRRTAEFRIRRLTRALDRLQERHTDLADWCACDDDTVDIHGRSARQALADCEEQILALEGELRGLFDDDAKGE